MADLEKRTSALRVNPNHFSYPLASDVNITNSGSDFYWAFAATFGVSALIFMGLSFKVPRSKRIFHYITSAICLVACIAYFTMASNLGYAAIAIEFQRSNPKVHGVFREVFYVRYIDWFVTTPLLLLDLLLTAGLPWPTILYTILFDIIMVVTGLVGALVGSSYKWGYFTFAQLSLFFIAYNVVVVGRAHARAVGTEKVYNMCGAWTIFLWFIYPICWGLSEGGNVIAPDSEAVMYGVLDLMAKPVFGALLLWGHRNIDPATLGVHIRDYDEPIGKKHHHGEKEAVVGNPGVTGATATGVDGAATGNVVGTHANSTAV
ncbi:family A G protein-coupled receptor-like protein [Coleophoma crateriformis]|uniref:Family A G protein-coupled receptor-like protein n=1 Tax=Coleophoma crateriformis TaxID=565419 RepID=A0A3D8RJI5_9HELO|nr:family A G protein-coupled receptor-like protein [Coleophoma crateriformis]